MPELWRSSRGTVTWPVSHSHLRRGEPHTADPIQSRSCCRREQDNLQTLAAIKSTTTAAAETRGSSCRGQPLIVRASQSYRLSRDVCGGCLNKTSEGGWRSCSRITFRCSWSTFPLILPLLFTLTNTPVCNPGWCLCNMFGDRIGITKGYQFQGIQGLEGCSAQDEANLPCRSHHLWSTLMAGCPAAPKINNPAPAYA
jgi:hypothetical protein